MVIVVLEFLAISYLSNNILDYIISSVLTQSFNVVFSKLGIMIFLANKEGLTLEFRSHFSDCFLESLFMQLMPCFRFS